MSQITVKNTSGKDAGKVDLDDATFGIEPNVPVMHQVVTAQLAARRAGTQSTKTRSEVRGGGAKPYRQKGTGNARQGSIRSPQFTGGGVALGPKPRKYNQKTPKKMIGLALRSALHHHHHLVSGHAMLDVVGQIPPAAQVLVREVQHHVADLQARRLGRGPGRDVRQPNAG